MRMYRKVRILAGVVIVVGGLLAVWCQADAGGHQSGRVAIPDFFSGKLVMVHVKGGTPYGCVLENLRLEEIGGQTFLIGKRILSEHKNDWGAGLVTGIPMDAILAFELFDSVEQYKATIRNYYLPNTDQPHGPPSADQPGG